MFCNVHVRVYFARDQSVRAGKVSHRVRVLLFYFFYKNQLLCLRDSCEFVNYCIIVKAMSGSI